MLLTPPIMLLRPSPYAEIPKQPWNPMLASVDPMSSAVTMSQPAQPEDTEAWVYGSKSKVWTYGLFPVVKISAKVRVYFVYNSPSWSIRQLTTNELDNLWDFPLVLQEKLENLIKNTFWLKKFHQFQGKYCS